MSSFINIVDNISAGGGTTINSGLTLALKTIRERKHINKVTSIFLLSDGQDKGAEQTFKNSLAAEKNKELGVFSLHSFGFGSDHDE
jgi:Mg-chelatase subunit ChlD